MGFKWGEELKKANMIIREQDECCHQLNKINDAQAAEIQRLEGIIDRLTEHLKDFGMTKDELKELID
jgi:hypothetical protein